MNPIKRAAKALCALDGHPENAKIDGKPLWHDYLPAVRAVVKAIREPGAGMLGAGSHEILAEQTNSAVHATSVWQAMIDAALEEKQ
ncbi:MAG: hypothetical protein EOP50_18310 [Sphingobacteriales bacterium]|nr:MAG: hypothetical protein EOP50_18310 [Sphingobacteriales bacterium]